MSGMEDRIDLRRFDLNHQLKGGVNRVDLIHGCLGGLHLLLKARQIGLPRVEDAYASSRARIAAARQSRQQVGMVLLLLGQASEERPHQSLVA